MFLTGLWCLWVWDFCYLAIPLRPYMNSGISSLPAHGPGFCQQIVPKLTELIRPLRFPIDFWRSHSCDNQERDLDAAGLVSETGLESGQPAGWIPANSEGLAVRFGEGEKAKAKGRG